MANFTVSVYTKGKLGYSNFESLHWDEVDHFEAWLSNLVQGPCIRVEIMEYER